MQKVILHKTLLIVVLLFMVFQAKETFASQVSGTLSAGYQAPSESPATNTANNQQVFFTVVSNKGGYLADLSSDVPMVVKVILIGGVALEVIALLIINFIKKRKRIYQ